MSQHEMETTDYEAAKRATDHVRLGRYFVYVDDEQALAGDEKKSRGRLERLLVKKQPEGGRRVLPLVDQPVELAGVTITPRPPSVDPCGCVVTDRDLYRAEQDTVQLFVAVPEAPEGLQLVVECNGQPFTTIDLELEAGLSIETLSMLLPGSYSAQLAAGESRLGTPVRFTVAEYTLAPLSGRLTSHQLERGPDRISFELAVESYQVPFDGKLRVILVDGEVEVKRTTLKPQAPGRYKGVLPIQGDGPFRLRLVAADDAERVAEVAIPGSRAAERLASVVSELGRERLFAMMPEPDALPLRGGYLAEGDFLTTPLTVEEIVSTERTLEVRADLEALTLVVLDLCDGSFSVQSHGDVATGETITVQSSSPMCTVFVGCFVDGNPFEGYTSFFRPGGLKLSLEVPETSRPGEEIQIRLDLVRQGADGGARRAATEVPVLLCVRDERLTATDTPAVALGASVKRGIDAATEGMAESGIEQLELSDLYPTGGADTFDDLVMLSAPLGVSDVLMAEDGPPPPSGAPPTMMRARASAALPDLSGEDFELAVAPMDSLASLQGGSFKEEKADLQEARGAGGPYRTQGREPTAEQMVEPARTEFPEVLFYALVPVTGSEEVTIDLGESLATFTVEAFALHDGDWVQTKGQVTVDKPVRLDLELPPTVHPKDKVTGRLRLATASGKARVELTRNGEPVPLQSAAGTSISTAGTLTTPVMLELSVKPGTYRAEVVDPESGERDAAEVIVNEPGKLRTMARQMGLLQSGDAITLDSAEALTLRVLPAVTETMGQLLTATASYSHLCCEQTAAKILAAVFMYLTADKDRQRRKAEKIILAGIAREKKMIRPEQGFVMYPGESYVSGHYSVLAVRYLWHLDQLDRIPDLPRNLRQAARQGLEMADTAANAHKMQRVPKKITSMVEAYASATSEGGNQAQARSFVDNAIDVSGREPRMKRSQHRVADRTDLAYAAATLLAVGDHERGVRLTDVVTRQLNDQGALYSTMDSVGAIAMMIQLRASGIVSGEGRVRVNGEEMSALEATELSDQVESVEVLKGVAAVEVTRILEEDWTTFKGQFKTRISFRDGHNKRKTKFRMGDRADLKVNLPDGYQVGDLVHVALPACMAWIKGGGKVKSFTLDFEGKNELRVPLIVTSKIEGKQHFAVCVRNMFEEERAASPGLMTVEGKGRWF